MPADTLAEENAVHGLDCNNNYKYNMAPLNITGNGAQQSSYSL